MSYLAYRGPGYLGLGITAEEAAEGVVSTARQSSRAGPPKPSSRPRTSSSGPSTPEAASQEGTRRSERIARQVSSSAERAYARATSGGASAPPPAAAMAPMAPMPAPPPEPEVYVAPYVLRSSQGLSRERMAPLAIPVGFAPPAIRAPPRSRLGLYVGVGLGTLAVLAMVAMLVSARRP